MSTPARQFESHAGQLAPLKEGETNEQLKQERLEERVNAPRLEKFLNQTLDAIASLDQNEKLKIHNSMVTCVAYYDGRWDGKVKNGTWVDNPKIDGEIIASDNEFKKQIDKLLMEMCRGRIEYDVEPIDKHSAALREAAEFAEWRVRTNQDRIETEPFLQDENQSLLLKTVAYRYTFFDKNAESRESAVEMDVMRQMVKGATVAVCRTCGIKRDDKVAEVDAADESRRLEFAAREIEASNCPNCGDTETVSVTAPDSEGMDIQQKRVPLGRVVTIRPDATMVELDLNARDIPSSSFIRWRLVLRRCDWEAMFPNTRIPSSDESQESRNRSEAQAQPSNTDWDATTEQGGAQFEKIEGELVWLDPKVTQRYASPQDEQLGQHVLKAGTKYNDQFAQGSCVARIGNKILDLFPSNKNTCWTMCVYGKREHALHGSGTTALLGQQDTINDLNSFILSNAYYMAAAREFVRSGAIEGGNLPPYNQVGIVTNAPEDRDILGYAYARSQPAALSGDVYNFRGEMKGSLQDGAGTSSLSMQGAADMKVLGTATGVEASRDQAVGRMIPNRKLQAHSGSEWAMQVLELEHEHYTAETFLELAGKANEKGEVQFTERGVRTFFDSDVRTTLVVKASEGSWVPTTPAQDRANANEFGMLSAQLGKSQNGPEMLSKLAPKYGIDYDINEWGAAQRSASIRLEEYARIAGVIAEGGYEPSDEMVSVVLQQAAPWAQVDPQMDNHAAFRNFYADWWQSDEGRNADPLLRMVIKAVHRLHREGTVEQEQGVTEDTIKAELPAKVAGAIEADITHDKQLEYAEETADAQDQREIAKSLIMPPTETPETELTN